MITKLVKDLAKRPGMCSRWTREKPGQVRTLYRGDSHDKEADKMQVDLLEICKDMVESYNVNFAYASSEHDPVPDLELGLRSHILKEYQTPHSL